MKTAVTNRIVAQNKIQASITRNTLPLEQIGYKFAPNVCFNFTAIST